LEWTGRPTQRSPRGSSARVKREIPEISRFLARRHRHARAARAPERPRIAEKTGGRARKAMWAAARRAAPATAVEPARRALASPFDVRSGDGGTRRTRRRVRPRVRGTSCPERPAVIRIRRPDQALHRSPAVSEGFGRGSTTRVGLGTVKREVNRRDTDEPFGAGAFRAGDDCRTSYRSVSA